MVTIPAMTPARREAFLSRTRIDPATGCHHWVGPTYRRGYGEFYSEGARYAAHRVAYTWWRGPIPDGLVIDHLCRIPGCVNPEHLEAVTNAENVRRGARGELKTHCVNGHPLTPDNLYPTPGRRACKTCGRKNRQKYLAKQASRR